ncbi:MAG TPA: hypothetical protein VK510_07555 [Solirubrobacteraceae bacterium]|jgi:hypothetical protein|nr:hypothetical protein [Solirubrobacteraceae bacterium]
MPVLDRSRDLWLTAIAKRTCEWRAALARDRRLRRIGAVGSSTPHTNAVRAEVFVRV